MGRGTFVCAQDEGGAGMIDLALNDPPAAPKLSLGALVADAATALLKDADRSALLSYRYFQGSADGAVAARWLAPFLGPIAGSRILITPGAQPALAAVLSTICKAGDAIVADPLTHPGFLWLARKFGLRIIPCPSDACGLELETLERICQVERPVALYTIPTAQNPTGITMPLDRRRAVADLAAAAGVWIIEADPFSPLAATPLPAIASMAPERTFYLSTLTKTFGGGFRVGHLAPPQSWLDAVSDSLMTLVLGPTPLTSAIFTRWFEEGVAQRVVEATRSELNARRRLAASILPQAMGGTDSPHLWVPLASSRISERLLLAARERNVIVVTEEAFAVDAGSPSGVRLTLGGAPDHAALEQALRVIRDLVDQTAPSTLALVL